MQNAFVNLNESRRIYLRVFFNDHHIVLTQNWLIYFLTEITHISWKNIAYHRRKVLWIIFMTVCKVYVSTVQVLWVPQGPPCGMRGKFVSSPATPSIRAIYSCELSRFLCCITIMVTFAWVERTNYIYRKETT